MATNKTKRIFFKTVRANGDSVWAIGRFNKNYQIGKRYRFSEKHPAHVFISDKDEVDSEYIYNNRREHTGGTRVLICYGVLEDRYVPFYEIDENWNLNKTPRLVSRWVSTDFTVIGEIKPKKPDQAEDPKHHGRVIEKRK